MSETYELRRGTSIMARSVEEDYGLIYVYLRYLDRIDVYKFTVERITNAESGDELIRVTEPSYRIAGGECTCDGYTYRRKCRHTDRIKRLSETYARGWTGAAE